MKFIYSLITAFAFTIAGFAQDAMYVKYDAEITNTGEDTDMMAMMMEGSSMEIASDGEKSMVKTKMGAMMSLSLELDKEADQTTIVMTGLMGDLAFQGAPTAEDEEDEEKPVVTVELTKEKKKILGYKCKKAIVTDAEGNELIYWYTTKFDRPEIAENMPEEIPGLSLEMEIVIQEGLKMTYTAVELEEDIDMDDYAIEIPEGVEIQSLSEMENLGM
jgi:GLPGLI family protein